MPVSNALVQLWQAVLWDQLLDIVPIFTVVMVASSNNRGWRLGHRSVTWYANEKL